MKIEAKFREGLKTLMKTKPLDEVNVVMLCDAVKSNRQTFYYHYRDISDVIESMFLRERVGFGVQPSDFDMIIVPLVAYINNNYQFLYAVANSFASDKLQEFFYSYIYQRTIQYIKFFKGSNPIAQTDTNYIARYLSTLISRESVYWVINKRKEKQTHLQRRLKLIWNYFINNYSKEMKEAK